MKILHTSDWHLGLSLCQREFLDIQQEWVNWLCQTVRARHIDAVLICGDVFDRAVSSPQAIRLYSAAMSALHAAGAAVLVIAGNHDGAARLSACAQLLEGSGVYIAGQLEAEPRLVRLGGVQFFLVPYFGAERARAIWPDCTGTADGMRRAVQQCRALRDKAAPAVLLAHCFAAGGVTSESDRAAVVGGSAAVGLDVFEGFDYVALGHLHGPQALSGQVRYCGTPAKYSFAEAAHTKSLPLYDSDTGEVALLECPEFARLRTVEGTLEQLLALAEADELQGCMVKAVRTDGPADLPAQSALRAAFPQLLQVEGRMQAAQHGRLSGEEVQALPADELLRLFYSQQTGEDPADELVQWFLAEMQAGEEEQ